MAKRSVGVTLRKPPQANTDTFVAGANDTHAGSATQALGDVVQTARGADLREVTVYLPKDLARKFALHCHELDRDASKVLAEMLEDELVPGPPAAGLAQIDHEPSSRWDRLREHVFSLIRARLPLGI